MERITKNILERRVDYLNKLTGNPAESYTREESGKLRANIGNYHLDWAYGGVSLVQMSTEGGGVSTVLHTGFTSKRALYDALNYYIEGIQLKAG